MRQSQLPSGELSGTLRGFFTQFVSTTNGR
jgi:hypothetical protein